MRLTKGDEHIYAVNAGSSSPQDYTVTIATYRTGTDATATLQRLAALFNSYLNRDGLVTGKEELHLADAAAVKRGHECLQWKADISDHFG